MHMCDTYISCHLSSANIVREHESYCRAVIGPQKYHQQYDAKPGNRDYCGLRPLGVQLDISGLETEKVDSVDA